MQWHDLLGAVLIDYFAGSAFVVETEVDLSLKKQFLDIVVIRKGEGEFDLPLPDGFGPLANYNLISFKSHQDTFDTWALQELIGYYVCYRKQVSADLSALLPTTDFRLLGISARFPEKLAKEIPLVQRQAGVYDIECGPMTIRLLVIRELAVEIANAMLMLFSTVPSQIEFAWQRYRKLNQNSSGIIDEMIRIYRKENEKMAITLEEIDRNAKQRWLQNLTLEQRLAGISAEEIQKRVPAEELLRGMPRHELAKALLREELQREPKPEEIDAFLNNAKK